MPETMLAAVFEGAGRLELKEVQVPGIVRGDDVLLKVDAVSICGTDIHIVATPPGYHATPNTILGHEFTGTVVAVGYEVSDLELGDRVVVNPNLPCGVCRQCQAHRFNLCENMTALGIDGDGAFAEYCRVSRRVIHRVAGDVPPGIAACAEPLACAVSAVWKASPRPGESVLVIGAGPIGLMIAMLCRASGASLTLIAEKAPFRVAFARSLKLGQVIDVTEQDLEEAIRGITTIGADLVFDVVGSQLAQAVELVRKGGRVVPFGVQAQAICSLPQSHVTMKEVTVIGSWLANASFPIAVSLLEDDSVARGLSKLVTHRIGLTEIWDGIELLRKGQAIKVVVDPSR